MELTRYKIQKQKIEQKIKQEFAERIIKRMVIELGDKKEIVIPKEFANIMGIKNSDTKNFIGFVYGVRMITY